MCEECKYYDKDEDRCGAFECNGLDCPKLPCEQTETLGFVASSMKQMCSTMEWLMSEYENQEPLRDSYIKIATLCLDLLCEINRPRLYNEICDEIREHRFIITRNGYGKHKVLRLYELNLEDKNDIR